MLPARAPAQEQEDAVSFLQAQPALRMVLCSRQSGRASGAQGVLRRRLFLKYCMMGSPHDLGLEGRVGAPLGLMVCHFSMRCPIRLFSIDKMRLFAV